MGLKELAELSRVYGSDERFVLAGGGNTSWKDDRFIYVKASGYALATIDGSGFAKMVRPDLDRIWSKEYPEDTGKREAVALKDLMDARAPGEEKRPSVETLLHEAIPDAYVVHTHPALVNGLTCARNGERCTDEVFGEEALWVPVVNPGYVLAVTVKRAMDRYRERTGRIPGMILLENHGVFVSSDDPAAIRRKYDEIFEKLEARIEERPDLSKAEVPEAKANLIESILRRELAQGAGGYGGSSASAGPLFIEHAANTELLRMLEDRASFEALSSAYTPDHFVYCGEDPLYLDGDENAEERLPAELRYFREKRGRDPKVVAVRGLGVFGCERSEKGAENAVALFSDAVKIAVYARSFGGPQFLPPDELAFLRSWEVEQYRAKVSTKKGDE